MEASCQLHALVVLLSRKDLFFYYTGALVSRCVLAVPRLRRLVASLSSRRPGFDPGSVHVEFVVDKVAVGQVFPRVLWFSAVIFISPVLHYTEKIKKKN